ncbi:hypothetical protein ABT160_37375 [Streptomyces sp. NPDC001941]|uniref:hypothetical protein n=1 Tax=Streptomyces sp. NPDC001941 TaxID=3154659 RepID=UPI0033329F4A
MPHRNADGAEDAATPVPAPGPGATFADKLNYLFDNLRPPRDGDPDRTNSRTGEFSHAYVAKTISGYGEGSLTSAYIYKLRKDEVSNPTVRVVQLLARFFGVPSSYFVDDATTERFSRQFAFVHQLNEAGVRNIAMRSVGLSEQSQAAVLRLVEAARELEGLPPAPDDTPPA